MGHQSIRLFFLSVIIGLATSIGHAANGPLRVKPRWQAGLNVGTITFMNPQETKFSLSVDLLYKIKSSWAIRSGLSFLDTQIDYDIHPTYQGRVLQVLSFQLGVVKFWHLNITEKKSIYLNANIAVSHGSAKTLILDGYSAVVETWMKGISIGGGYQRALGTYWLVDGGGFLHWNELSGRSKRELPYYAKMMELKIALKRAF